MIIIIIILLFLCSKAIHNNYIDNQFPNLIVHDGGARGYSSIVTSLPFQDPNETLSSYYTSTQAHYDYVPSYYHYMDIVGGDKDCKKQAVFILPLITKNGIEYTILGKERFGSKVGKYSLIGGGVDSGEEKKEAIIREIYEESRLLPKDATGKDLKKLMRQDFSDVRVIIPFPGQDCNVYVFEVSPTLDIKTANKKLEEAVTASGNKYSPDVEMSNLAYIPIENVKKMKHNKDVIKDMNDTDLQISFIAFKTIKMYTN